MPYMFINLLFFYIVNVIHHTVWQNHSLTYIKYGIIKFESSALDFPIMLFVLFLVELLVIKIETLNTMLGEQDEEKYEMKYKQKTLKSIQKQSSILSIIYYIFYLTIEACLIFILLINVVSKVNLSNF